MSAKINNKINRCVNSIIIIIIAYLLKTFSGEKSNDVLSAEWFLDASLHQYYRVVRVRS